jgi:hypothetical protein
MEAVRRVGKRKRSSSNYFNQYWGLYWVFSVEKQVVDSSEVKEVKILLFSVQSLYIPSHTATDYREQGIPSALPYLSCRSVKEYWGGFPPGKSHHYMFCFIFLASSLQFLTSFKRLWAFWWVSIVIEEVWVM